VGALATACVARVARACRELDGLYADPRRERATAAESIASRYFLDRCRKHDDGAGCYQFGVFMKTPHLDGTVKPDPDLEREMYREGCEKGDQLACSAAQREVEAPP
jgi:hypothetical protein